MIIVKGRELLIPENERYIGTNYDAGMENRLFRIPRYSQSGTDLSDLVFKINLVFDGDPLDRAEMVKAVEDDYIYLTWAVTAAQVVVTGTVFACITGNDTNDTVKWSSFQAPFYTEKSLGDDIDTAYHDLVNKVAQEIADRENAVSAERTAREAAVTAEATARQTADTTLQQNIDAEAAARAAGDAAANTRIDNIVAQSGDDITEIVDARTGADSVVHASLKARLDAENSQLKSQLNEAADLFSDGATLLSSSLSDKSSTSSGISYSLSGNTVTLSGTATAVSFFAVLGTSTSAPPAWMVAGKRYVVSIANTAIGAKVLLQAKTTSNTSIHSVAEYAVGGTYIFNVPTDITVFRLGILIDSGITVSGTITIEMSNVISANEVKSDLTNYFALDADNVIMIPDNTDFDTLTTPGTYKVTNNTHAATMPHIPEATAGKLVVVATAQASRLTQLYFTVKNFADIYIRTYNADGWNTWYRLLRDDEYVNPIRVGKYATGSDDIAESFSVYIPATDGYIRYSIRHYISDSKNCNGWQIYHAYHVNSMFGNETDLTISGEWECALRLSGRDDFSGGYTHGDEIMSNISFLVDGIPTDITTLTNRANAKEFRIIQTSILYDPADHTTAIAEHGKEYIFTKDGLTINQSVEWLVTETLTNCFLCMFLPSKNYIDRAAANSDFKTCVLPSATGQPLTTIVKGKANAVEMWDTASGFSANVSVPVYPTGLSGGDQISISDNGGNDYNKVYFKVCGGGTSAVGELWKSTSVYRLNYA